MLQLWAGVMCESSESASWRKKKKKGEREDGGEDGFKYVGDQNSRVDTAVLVYFAAAFAVKFVLACCSGRLNTVASGRGVSCRASVPQGFSVSNVCLHRHLGSYWAARKG